jgi:hypothetical protein
LATSIMILLILIMYLLVDPHQICLQMQLLAII